jgi:phage-related minor tail protein
MSNDVQLGIKVTADSKAATPELSKVAAEEQKIAQNAQNAASQLSNQNKQLQNTTLSAAQMTQALRQVPMQFTDIVTSLGSGQKPLQVLLQQGGQLKDSFGGIGPAVRGLTGYITSLINPTSVAVTAAVGLATAYFNGAKQSQILKDTVILTGEAAGKTASQLETLAQVNGQLTGKFSDSRQAANELALSGKLAGDQIDIALRGVIATSQATGKEVSDVVEVFVKLAEDPAKAIKTLNTQYNFLTADIYRQIVALQEQGKTQEAATLAIKTFADTMDSRKTQVLENAGLIERSWNKIKSAIDGAKESLLSIGRDESLDEQISNAQAKLRSLQSKTGYTYTDASGTLRAATRGSDKEIEAQKAVLADLLRVKRTSEILAKEASDFLAGERDKVNAVDELNKYLGSSSRLSGAGLVAKQLEDENKAFQSATRGLQKNSAEYQQALQAHEQAIANIKASAQKKNSSGGKSDAQQIAEDTARLIQNFQQAVAPAQALSEKLQEQLNNYVGLDPAVKKYLQGLADQVKATEEAKIAQEALNEAIARNNDVMEGIQAGEDADKAVYNNNAKVYQDILRETEDMNIAMIESDRERARAQIDIEHQRRLERIGSMEGEQDQIDVILEAEEERYRTAVKNIGNETKKTKSISQELGLTMKSSFEEAVLSGKKLSDVLQGIFEDITKILLRKNVTEPLAEAISGSDLGGIFDSIFGGNGSGTIFNAKGNVYPVGDISQYSNSIVNKPTFFTGSPRAFAKGGNVMGEAGAEGIFPLRRMSNGNLGVEASGAGGASIIVNLVETSDKNKQGTVETSDNGATVTAYIESIVDRKLQNDLRRNTGFPKQLESTYNLMRSPGG